MRISERYTKRPFSFSLHIRKAPCESEVHNEQFYPYSFLKNAFDKLLKCINDRDYNQVYALADALHNVPIFLSDGCKNLKKALRIEFSYYDKKYGTDLRKELLQRKFEE